MVKKLSYIDLFSGCGGISLGLYNAGLQGLFAVEKNQDAFETLKHNLIDKHSHFSWPEWLEMKNWYINMLLRYKSNELLALRGKVDLIVGGPPCQGFSVAGKRTASDRRNELIHSYLDFVELVQPRVIMFENVGGFTHKFSNSKNYKHTPYSEIVLNKLIELGYQDAHGKMVDVAEYGVPQRRQRFVVIGTREKLGEKIFSILQANRESYLHSKGLQIQNTLYEAISDLERGHGVVECPDTRNFMSGVTSFPRSNFQEFLRFPNEDNYVPDSHRYVNHTEATQKVFDNLLENAPRDELIRGKDRKNFGIKKRSLTVLDSDKPSRTITTIPDDFVHYSEPRVMTVRECARIQTFPDWFEFKGPYTSGGKYRKKNTPRYTQVGNAVPPLFAEQLGNAIKKALTNE